ncbi:MAG TPA: type II toxin-antitoxin system RelE/ParE family toxin [Phycisphaerae bacterium]|nr:type II toxin-antitoxin system RelE/ParE family toxin [Phycisphaerae bacterium]
MKGRYRVEIDTRAGREIRDLQRAEQVRIVGRIESLAQNPRPHGCVKLSGGQELWRIRVGQYRVIYQVRDDRLMVMIVKVGNRRDVYR